MIDIQNLNTEKEREINTSYNANNPEPIEMREESVKTKQEDALHSALEYINGDNGEVQ